MKRTHDWSVQANIDHVFSIQKDLMRFSEGGVTHLVLEVIAYAVDEANEGTTDHILVTLSADGSICVTDNGRGTAIREVEGVILVKPIIATPDLRFFGVVDAPILPDGRIRSGISVVGALSEWVTHTNRREGRSWTQRYRYGLPQGPLTEGFRVESTGTTICFHPDVKVFGTDDVTVQTLRDLCLKFGDAAEIAFRDERRSKSPT